MKSNKGIIFIIATITFFSFFINSESLFPYLTKIEVFTKPENEIEKNQKSSGFWDLTGSPISIDDNNPSKNWAITAATYSWCSGSGTLNDPYLIENVTIDGQGLGSCIEIRNSDDKYFIIRNCTLYNSGSNLDEDGGIEFETVYNGTLFNNNCSNNNANGIILKYSYNNNISGNIVNDNSGNGIHLRLYSCENNIIGNMISHNHFGISIKNYSEDNIISNNSVIDCSDKGIILITSHYNTISGNFIHSTIDEGLRLGGSNNNIISYNEIIIDNFFFVKNFMRIIVDI